jgi:hypothetical protein
MLRHRHEQRSRTGASRATAGIEAARRRGPTGRPYPDKISHPGQMVDSGEQSVTGMAEILDVHLVSLHKALKGEIERMQIEKFDGMKRSR